MKPKQTRKQIRPHKRQSYVNFLVSPDEKANMGELMKRIGADPTGLIRVALRIIDEQGGNVDKIQAQQARTILTNIHADEADKALIERIAARNNCTKSDVIRYAIHALHTRGLRFG